MAFDREELNVLAYANGFTLWHYRTNDGISEVRAKDYFIGDSVRTGDVVVVSSPEGTEAFAVGLPTVN